MYVWIMKHSCLCGRVTQGGCSDIASNWIIPSSCVAGNPVRSLRKNLCQLWQKLQFRKSGIIISIFFRSYVINTLLTFRKQNFSEYLNVYMSIISVHDLELVAAKIKRILNFFICIWITSRSLAWCNYATGTGFITWCFHERVNLPGAINE